MVYCIGGKEMKFDINRTDTGVITYPLHSHTYYEILYYLKGQGVLKTEKGDIPYSKGTVIIVPPCFLHGSSSDSGFQNISINGDFRNLLKFKEVVVMKDNEKNEGKLLAELLYNNRLNDNDFLSSLCETYILFLLSNLKIDNNIDNAINKVISEISISAYDSNFNLTTVLNNSGYAEDYIRNQFKIKTGKTPTRFLTEIRINHACYLIDIYKNNCSMTQISEQCGFVDYIYFSKRFKQITGLSPNEYKKKYCGLLF